MSDQTEFRICEHGNHLDELCADCRHRVMQVDVAIRYLEIVKLPTTFEECFKPVLEVISENSDLGCIETVTCHLYQNEVDRKEARYVYSYMSLWHLLLTTKLPEVELPDFFHEAMDFLRKRLGVLKTPLAESDGSLELEEIDLESDQLI